MTVDLSFDELFLIEMALDQVLYTLQDTNSPAYKRYQFLDQKFFGLRKKAEQSGSAGKSTPET